MGIQHKRQSNKCVSDVCNPLCNNEWTEMDWVSW